MGALSENDEASSFPGLLYFIECGQPNTDDHQNGGSVCMSGCVFCVCVCVFKYHKGTVIQR